MEHDVSYHAPPVSRLWSNRILIASLSGIFFLTLYPFRLDLHATVSSNWSPFLLEVSHKPGTLSDAFLNILLFVPFGLGLASLLHKRRYSWLSITLITFFAGAFCSYAIEFIQIYIPGRDSGWEDVITNSGGSLVGSMIFMMAGESLLARFSHWGKAVEAWLSNRRFIIVVLAYFVLWMALSIPLQHATRLSNWDASCPIYIGDDANGKSAWRGHVTFIDIWNRPWQGSLAPTNSGAFVTYELTGDPPFEDKDGHLPALVPLIRLGVANGYLGSSGFTRLTTALPVSRLAQELEKTNQFSMLIEFTPLGIDEGEHDIFSVSNSRGINNVLVWQEGADIHVSIRNRLAVKHAQLFWTIAGIITPEKPVSLIVSYDGSGVSFYVNGGKARYSSYISPGASLMQRFIRIRSFEMLVYSVIYNALIFVPIGVLLGIVARRFRATDLFFWVGFAGVVLIPPTILEFLLVRVSGRTPHFSLILLGASLTIAGALWINADRPQVSAAEPKDA